MELNQILEGVEKVYGFNPAYVYCTHTGRPIASLEIEELQMTQLTLRATDLETAIDEMAMRLLGFCRPAPAWGHMTPETLEHVRVIQPGQLLAYLLNRLYEPHDSHTAARPMSHMQRVQSQVNRIRRWAQLESMPMNFEQRDALLLILLELDSRLGLHILTPKNIPAIDSWHTDAGIAKAIIAFESWRDILRADIAKHEAQKKSEIAWARDPNRMTQKPFIKQFWEAKPPSESQKRKLKKAADMDMLSSLFDSIVLGTDVKRESAPEPAPLPKVVFKASQIVSFGVKGA